MRRSTLFALAIGAGAALFSYTPTAAQWLALARDEGITIPEELQSPPAIGGAVLTIIVYLAVLVFRRVNAWIDGSEMRGAIAAEAIRQSVTAAAAADGARIIANRNRRKEITADLREIDEARAEHAKERATLLKELAAADEMLGTAKMEQTKACADLDRLECGIETLAAEADDRRARLAELDRSDSALSQTKTELLAEQRALS